MTVICWVVAAAAILYLAARLVPQGIARGEFRDAETPLGVQTSARWLGAECRRLASADASWAEVSASVNPEQDVEIGTLPARICASHSREPRAGLMAIEEGCSLAIEQNDTASMIDGPTVTVRDLPALSVVRW